MKYEYLLSYGRNIGDEIQSVAAKRFLPHIDYYISRDSLASFQANTTVPIKFILNGFFWDKGQDFPAPKIISPLLVSMHLNTGLRDFILSHNDCKEYFIKHGPVGCRDKSTLKFFLDNNIPAYFSGCLTLTLKGNEKMKSSISNKYILCVDIPDDVFDYITRKSDKTVYRISKVVTNRTLESLRCYEIAKIYLYLYHNASAVITTNLHTALPCLAFNTPVCLIRDKYDIRFDGPDAWLNHCKRSDFISGKFYDINNPPDNPREFVKYRDSLIKTCKDFTGFDSNTSIFEDNYMPKVFDMLNVSTLGDIDDEENKQQLAIKRISGKKLVKAAAKRIIRKIFRK